MAEMLLFCELKKFPICAITLQMVIIILFLRFVDYGWQADGRHHAHGFDPILGGQKSSLNSIYANYNVFQDVHVMVFIGFGFLFTFLKKYSYSAVGVNMLLAAVLIQWALLCEGFFAFEDKRIKISIEKLLTADVAAAAGLISWGALLGKTSPLQLLIMALIEMPLFACNEWLTLEVYQASDPGASMICHVFGAYFGLAATTMLYQKHHHGHSKEGAVYHSDVFAMLGTIFLWLFWPSFNAALTTGDDRHRAIINTYLSLAACCVMTFAISARVDSKGRFNMVHIQNATLAGGVAMGTACATMLEPYVALIIGSLAAIICTLGFKYLTPVLAHRLHIHDTCGVNDLHGMMGIFGGIVGAVMASLASEDMYGYGLYKMYPAMTPPANSNEYIQVISHLSNIEPGPGRSASVQAGYQLAALFTTLGISITGGLLAGLLMRLSIFDPPNEHQVFDDMNYWEIPDLEDQEGSTIELNSAKVLPKNGMSHDSGKS